MKNLTNKLINDFLTAVFDSNGDFKCDAISNAFEGINKSYMQFVEDNDISTIDNLTQHFFTDQQANNNYYDIMCVWDIIKEFHYLPYTRLINDLLYLRALNLYYCRAL